jgi:Photosynthetic reaction centre cytochrome C subunit
LKLKSFAFAFAASLLLAASGIAATAQAPALPPAGPNGHHFPPPPPPTNLQVLPKTMTGEQVHELMHKWEGELGTECSTCHAADPKNLAPNGRPRLDFALDTKPEKATARLMYKMVQEINTQYIGKIDNSGVPVTCGTCHRGHLTPEPFVAPKDDDHDHHDHDAPPAGEKPPQPR